MMLNSYLTMKAVRCTLYSVCCTTHTEQHKRHKLYCTTYTLKHTMHNKQCSMYTAQCTQHNAHCTMYNALHNIWCKDRFCTLEGTAPAGCLGSNICINRANICCLKLHASLTFSFQVWSAFTSLQKHFHMSGQPLTRQLIPPSNLLAKGVAPAYHSGI